MKRFRSMVLVSLAMGTGWASAAEKLEVASLSSVLTDFARRVGGHVVEVVEVVPAGVDVHAFEPTVSDVRKAGAADLVLASGLGFEVYLNDLQDSAGGKAKFVVVGDSVEPLMAQGSDDHGHSHSHSHGHGAHADDGDGETLVDPHWWHSIENAKIAVRVLRDAFAQADPDKTEIFRNNAASYLAELDELQKEIKVKVAELPRDRRVLITSHDALAYFADDFGFEIYPVQGLSTTDQPSSKQVRDIIDMIRAEKIPAIFAENVENPKVLEEIARETGAVIGGELYADGLGTDEAATYVDMMRHNTSTIVEALQPRQ